MDEFAPKNLCSQMFGSRSRRIPISAFCGLVYGGQTASFNRHKKRLAKNLERNHTTEEELEKPSSDEVEFYPWQCISLIREFSTLDFVVKDQHHMAALFYFAFGTIYD